jgi:predicted Zn-dependent protease
MKNFLRLFSVALTLGSIAFAADHDDVVFRAMRDELARSMSQLRLENLEKPYFISYRVEETRSQQVAAQFGATLGRSEGRNRAVAIEVRVGSPALDNTNFAGGFGGTTAVSLATDDNYDVLRRQLWLATDRAYKAAAEQFSRKKAALQNKTRTEVLPDFSPEPVTKITDLHPAPPIDLDRAEMLVRELSTVFRETPGIANSLVQLSATQEHARYVNSEGSSFSRAEFQVRVAAAASTQAADGFPIDDQMAIYARSWDTLPPKAELTTSVRELARRVSSQRDAALLEQYNGPVLFEGQAAAEIFAQTLGPLFSARPRAIGETGGRGPGGRGPGGRGPGGAAENPFLDKLGARVMPDIFTVVDNPTLTSLNGAPVFGNSQVDDEGVPSRLVLLVEKGRLRTLLVARTPVRGVTRSTGSMKAGNPLPSNLVVTATDGQDAAALKAELLKLVEQRGKEYGIIVRRLGTGARGGGRGETAVVAVKVLPDGREELLRNLEVAGVDAPTFKDILVAGREPYIYTTGFRGSVVTFAVPSLLFEDITLKKPAGEIALPPIAKHPFFDR